MSQKKLVVFDLDGTLNKTELYAVPAHQKALGELNIFDKSDELIISTFGERAQDSLMMLINTTDEKLGKEYLTKVSQYESEFIVELAGEYDGVSSMLDKLQKDGYHTAVCSNASERYIRMVLSRLNILDKVNYIQPLIDGLTKDDTLRLLIERESPDKTVMVGDRIFDKNAAAANKIPFIGCMYGFKSEEVANADIPVHNPCEINEAVKKLIG